MSNRNKRRSSLIKSAPAVESVASTSSNPPGTDYPDASTSSNPQGTDSRPFLRIPLIEFLYIDFGSMDSVCEGNGIGFREIFQKFLVELRERASRGGERLEEGIDSTYDYSVFPNALLEFGYIIAYVLGTYRGGVDVSVAALVQKQDLYVVGHCFLTGGGGWFITKNPYFRVAKCTGTEWDYTGSYVEVFFGLTEYMAGRKPFLTSMYRLKRQHRPVHFVALPIHLAEPSRFGDIEEKITKEMETDGEVDILPLLVGQARNWGNSSRDLKDTDKKKIEAAKSKLKCALGENYKKLTGKRKRIEIDCKKKINKANGPKRVKRLKVEAKVKAGTCTEDEKLERDRLKKENLKSVRHELLQLWIVRGGTERKARIWRSIAKALTDPDGCFAASVLDHASITVLRADLSYCIDEDGIEYCIPLKEIVRFQPGD